MVESINSEETNILDSLILYIGHDSKDYPFWVCLFFKEIKRERNMN